MGTQTYSGLSAQQKTFYDRVLIDRLLANLYFVEHGQKKPMPKNEGDTANFRRFERLEPSPTPLTEGVTPTGLDLDIISINATVEEYGRHITMSNKLDMVGIDPVITETTELLGEHAAETLDEVVRDIVAAGTNVFYVNSRTSRGTVESGDNIDGATMRRIRQIMVRNNVKPVPKAGAFIAFIHPDVSYDIMGDSAWVNANQYAGSTKLFNGEIGKMYGVRYIETTKAPIWEGEGASSIDVYGTIVVGRGAYGVPDVQGSGKPEIIVKPKGSAGTADPLNQRSSVGWWAMLTSVRLDELCILRVESAASVGAL